MVYSARPDGSAAPPARLHAFFPADEPRCPRCGLVLLKHYPHWGSSFAECMRKRAGVRCGQPVMIVAAGQICAVIALTRAELNAVRREGRRADEILRELQILGVPMVPASTRPSSN